MDVKFLNTGLFLQGKSIFSSRHLFTVNVLYFLLLLTFQPNHSSQMYAQSKQSVYNQRKPTWQHEHNMPASMTSQMPIAILIEFPV